MIRWYANIRNGLAYPHDEVCCFLSTYGHHLKDGYFRLDAMPYSAVILLLTGHQIGIVDGTQHDKPLSDALRFGVPTWCRVFNRAIKRNEINVCPWETVHMRRAANQQRVRPIVQTIRKLTALYGAVGPAVIGENVILKCHRKVEFDDKPEMLQRIIGMKGN